MTQAEKTHAMLNALKQIREMGYNSQAARATDTVLACIRVAEDAILIAETKTRTAKRTDPPEARLRDAYEHVHEAYAVLQSLDYATTRALDLMDEIRGHIQDRKLDSEGDKK